MTSPQVVILAAGQGTRMRSPLPKVLHPLCGRPILGWVLDQARSLDPERIVIVVGHGAEAVKSYVAENEGDLPVRWALQSEQLGTGHAVLTALGELADGDGPIVVLYGDMPCLRPVSLASLLARLSDSRAAITTARPAESRGFGRILRQDGHFAGIVEEKDATDEQRSIAEVNVGVYAFASEDLRRFLPQLSNANAQGEYYLTDVLTHILDEQPGSVATVDIEQEADALGINTLGHLSEARAVIQERILEAHLAAGVAIEDPATTYIDHGVEIGSGTHVLPCTVIRGGVRIGSGCEVGPFTHLRVGTVLEDGAEVGNFCEAKKSTVGRGTKAKHLTYMGDVTIGEGVNIGAGTIVANYDGTHKHPTRVGDHAFVGSGSILIAPCNVGKGSLTGAGAVVTGGSEVGDGEVWVGVPARRLEGSAGDDQDR